MSIKELAMTTIWAIALKIASYPSVLVASLYAKDLTDPRGVGLLFDVGAAAFYLFQAALAVSVAAIAASALATRALPRWLGWGAAMTALAMAVNVVFAYKTPEFAPAVFLFMLWALAACIVLIRRAGAPAAGEAAQPITPEPVPILVLSVISLLLRFRRSRGEERQQLKWVAAAGALAVLLLLNGPVFWFVLPPPLEA
jgi:hypothetical protein